MFQVCGTLAKFLLWKSALWTKTIHWFKKTTFFLKEGQIDSKVTYFINCKDRIENLNLFLFVSVLTMPRVMKFLIVLEMAEEKSPTCSDSLIPENITEPCTPKSTLYWTPFLPDSHLAHPWQRPSSSVHVLSWMNFQSGPSLSKSQNFWFLALSLTSMVRISSKGKDRSLSIFDLIDTFVVSVLDWEVGCNDECK